MKNEGRVLTLELNFEARIRHYKKLIEILKDKQKLLSEKEAGETDPLKKVEYREKLWHLETEIDAKMSYIIELLARQDKASQLMKEKDKGQLFSLKKNMAIENNGFK